MLWSSWEEYVGGIITIRFREIMSFKEDAINGSDVEFVHNMRISIKRPRYSMEAFSVNCGKRFSEPLQVWVNFQKLLGDIHDYDVSQNVLIDCLKNSS